MWKDRGTNETPNERVLDVGRGSHRNRWVDGHERGSEGEGIQLRGAHHLLRLHAVHRDGELPPNRLLQVAGDRGRVRHLAEAREPVVFF